MSWSAAGAAWSACRPVAAFGDVACAVCTPELRGAKLAPALPPLAVLLNESSTDSETDTLGDIAFLDGPFLPAPTRCPAPGVNKTVFPCEEDNNKDDEDQEGTKAVKEPGRDTRRLLVGCLVGWPPTTHCPWSPGSTALLQQLWIPGTQL